MTEKAFTLFWRDGYRNVVHGSDIASAMNRAGYGGGALGALDFYADGDDKEYTWDADRRSWQRPMGDWR